MKPEQLARKFHEAYERLAPQFDYVTRDDTRAFDPESANGRLMIAVCAEMAEHFGESAPEQKEDDGEPTWLTEIWARLHNVQIELDSKAPDMASVIEGIDDVMETLDALIDGRDPAPVLAPSVDTNAERPMPTPIPREANDGIAGHCFDINGERWHPLGKCPNNGVHLTISGQCCWPADAPQEPTCAHPSYRECPTGKECPVHGYNVESSVLPSKSEYARGRMDEMQGKQWNDTKEPR